jgi:hypothetical protein
MASGMRNMNVIPFALAPLALVACAPPGTDPGPGDVTVDEARALDDAAAMLDARRLPPEALPSAAASATETPESAGEN